jgi:lipase
VNGRDEQSLDVPVRGGTLHAGRWEGSGTAVLAIHGITSTHAAWAELASLLPELTVLAPDLRGRGRSAQLPGPYGLRTHVADLISLLDAAGQEQVVVTGHSMGAFVAVALAAEHPDRVSDLVLVDGGLPSGGPDVASAPQDEAPQPDIEVLLGPAAARLAMTWPSHEAHRDFWRAHPAIGPLWGPAIAEYLDYDLVGEPPAMHSSCRVAAMRVDGAEMLDRTATMATLRRVHAPVSLLAAERGLLDTPPPAYSAQDLSAWPGRPPVVEATAVPNTNHYSILLGTPGATAVAAAIRSVAAKRHPPR